MLQNYVFSKLGRGSALLSPFNTGGNMKQQKKLIGLALIKTR